MIAKIGKNASYGATVAYVMGPGKDNVQGRAELIGGNMAGKNAESITREFEQLALGKEDVGKKVLHISLNANPADGKLSDERWNEIAKDFLKNYGVDSDKHPWMLVRHSDKTHDHTHLVVSRIGFERELFKPVYKDSLHAQRVCRQLEQKYGLTPTVQGQRSLDQGLIADLRTKITATRDVSRGKGFDAFKARLAADHDIKTIEFRDKSGRLNGLQFQAGHGRAPVRAGDLGEEFRTKNLMSEMSPATTPRSRTTTIAGKQAGNAAGKAIPGAISKMQGVPKIPKLPQLPGMGGLTGQIGKSVATGMQGAIKAIQQQAAKSQRKAKDHELE